jgi:hypothetical protein
MFNHPKLLKCTGYMYEKFAPFLLLKIGIFTASLDKSQIGHMWPI